MYILLNRRKICGYILFNRSMFISDYILEDMISYGYLSKIMIIYVYFMSE